MRFDWELLSLVPFSCEEDGNVIFENIKLVQKNYNSSKLESIIEATINFL